MDYFDLGMNLGGQSHDFLNFAIELNTILHRNGIRTIDFLNNGRT